MPAGGSRVVAMPGNVPPDATAVVVNITITDGNAGYWTAYAAGTPRPSTSNVNIDVGGRIVPNQAVVPVSPAGIEVFSEAGRQPARRSRRLVHGCGRHVE